MKCDRCEEEHDYKLEVTKEGLEVVTEAHGGTREIIWALELFHHKTPLDPYPEGA